MPLSHEIWGLVRQKLPHPGIAGSSIAAKGENCNMLHSCVSRTLLFLGTFSTTVPMLL